MLKIFFSYDWGFYKDSLSQLLSLSVIFPLAIRKKPPDWMALQYFE